MKVTLLAAAAALVIATPVFAAGTPASTNVVVNGTVTAQCGVGHQSGGGTRSIASPVTVPVVDANGQLDTATTTQIAIDNIWCNAPNTLVMDVTQLSLKTPPTGGWDTSSFVAAVDMVVSSDSSNNRLLPTYCGGQTTLQSAGATDGIATEATEPAFETGTGKFSQALLTLAMPATAHSKGVRPLAGDYTGTVTVTATPN